MPPRLATPATAPWLQSPRLRLAIMGLILAAALVLLLARLGHYALWDDESATALAGVAVWETGDTYAMVGHNVVAFRDGFVLKNLYERYTSPLSAYLVAPFTALDHGSAFSVRLPEALLGVASVLLLLWWCWQAQADARTLLVFGMVLLGNVSFFLYFRQCRYYAASAFLTLALAYLYLHRRGRRWEAPLFATLALLLFATNYINFGAFFICLGVDYLLWGHRARPLTWREAATIVLPVALLGGVIFYIWNPLQFGASLGARQNTPLMRLYLLLLLCRDFNRCELGAGPLLLLCPLLYLVTRAPWLLRGFVGLLMYLAAVALLSPQHANYNTVWADTRYLSPVLPLAIALGALAVIACCRRLPWAALLLAAVLYLTNLANDNWRNAGFRCTLSDYAGELAHPNPEPYTPMIQWVNAHVAPGASILVLPSYMMYPLMYHAPQAVYAWQLRFPPEPQFAHLPLIHFRDQVWPDYILGCGPMTKPVVTDATFTSRYRLVDIIDTYWKDAYRPELYWHRFHPQPYQKEHGEAIYVFQRTSASPAAAGDSAGNR